MSTIDAAAVDRLVERARMAVDDEGLPAAQLAVLHDGKVIADVTFGAPDSARFVAFSTAKSVSSGVLIHLLARGDLALEDAAASWIPEFDRPGFREVTVEHLLTHRAGFPNAPLRNSEAVTREGRGARYASWRLDWPPGERYHYHPTSAHWVLADIALAVTGLPFSELARERVLDPLGLHRLALGLPVDEQGDIQALQMVGDAERPAIAIGRLFPEARPEVLLRFREPAVIAAGSPGGGLVATARDLAGYVAAWLRPDAAPWSPAWIADATSHIRVTVPDAVTNVAANRTLAFVIAGDDAGKALRELGSAVGPRTFSCTGLGGQVAWADPDSGLAFCFLTSGINHDVVRSWQRGAELNDLAAQCVA